MHRITRCLGLLLGLAQISAANAETWYELELVAFLRAADQVKTVEQPTPAQALVMPEQFWAFSLDGLSGGTQLRSGPLSHLASAHDRLERSGTHRVVFAAAWKQGLGAKSLPILLQVGESAPGIYGLEGTLTLQHHRFLQANLNLGYSEFLQLQPLETTEPRVTANLTDVSITPATDTNHPLQPDPVSSALDSAAPVAAVTTPEPAPAFASNIRISSDGASQWQIDRSYQIAGEHRLHLAAVNYIDHPQLGLLLYAKPIDVPPPDAAGAADAPQQPDQTTAESASSPDAVNGALKD